MKKTLTMHQLVKKSACLFGTNRLSTTADITHRLTLHMPFVPHTTPLKKTELSQGQVSEVLVFQEVFHMHVHITQ